MKKFVSKLTLLAASVIMTAQAASAQTQFQGFNIMVDDANRSITDSLANIINFASIVIGVVAAVMLIWNYIKRSKNDASSNDALASWGFGLLYALLGLQVIKFIMLHAI